jgi:hypothetical protein
VCNHCSMHNPPDMELDVREPSHVTGTAPYVSYGIRVANVGGPLTVALVAKVMELLATSTVTVPPDAQIQWGYPDIWVSWRRHDPLGKYEHVG